MTKYNASPVLSSEKQNTLTITTENIKDHHKKESYSVAADAHEQECCVNYEQCDTTLQTESL
jgi:hypothetical protein